MKLHQVTATPEWWHWANQFADQVTFHTKEWISFLADTHHATPVFAEVRDGSSVVGCFHALIIQRFGLRILASPFPGWTTEYMGFNLQPGVPRWLALRALEHFAFRDLHCVYFEVADRLFTPEDGKRGGFEQRISSSYETDLTQSEEAIFSSMAASCRRCIRKAARCGVVIDQAGDNDDFAAAYYKQLEQVFHRQGLLPTYSLDTVRKLIYHLRPTGNLALFRARDADGKCIATGIYHGTGKFAQLWGNASVRESLHLRPNQALHWHALRYWRERGAEYFDWGGGGAYKEKYGCRKVAVVRFAKASIPFLSKLRDQAQRAYFQQLRWRSWWKLSARRSFISSDETRLENDT
jgi:Acetyltransferase (GNAT) domain